MRDCFAKYTREKLPEILWGKRRKISMSNTDWFYERGYGIFVHHMESIVNDSNRINSMGKSTSWDECLRDFDYELFASQVAETGAGYVIITIMQGSKYMLAPNETYNRITGYQPGEACPTFDFIEELYEALHKRDIDLMLYYTGNGPHLDEIAGNAFGHRDRGPVSQEFLDDWTAVLREYSMRYGTKIKGWWMDGFSAWRGYNNTDGLDKLKMYVDACKAGNPDAIVAFNHYGVINEWGGQRKWVAPGTRVCDYTAGEMIYFEDIPVQPFIHGTKCRWHILSHIAKSPDQMAYNGWAKPGSNYSPEYLADYYGKVHEHGGVMSIDVCVFRDGHIDAEQLEVISALKSCKGKKPGRHFQ